MDPKHQYHSNTIGMLPVLPRGDQIIPPIIQTRGMMDNNYNDNTAVDGSQIKARKSGSSVVSQGAYE